MSARDSRWINPKRALTFQAPIAACRDLGIAYIPKWFLAVVLMGFEMRAATFLFPVFRIRQRTVRWQFDVQGFDFGQAHTQMHRATPGWDTRFYAP
jgi:hypothetical protein